MNLQLQGGAKSITLKGIDTNLVPQIAEQYHNDPDRFRVVDEAYGAEMAYAVEDYLNNLKMANTTNNAPPINPMELAQKLIIEANNRYGIANTEGWTNFRAKVHSQYGNETAKMFWAAYLQMVAEDQKYKGLVYSKPTPESTEPPNTLPYQNDVPKEDETNPKSKMWAWIAGIGAALGLYAMSKKGKGLSGLGCACDDKDKPMAGVKTSKNRKPKIKNRKSKPFTLKM